MNLSDIKASREMLLDVLGVTLDSHGMAKCPFHKNGQESRPSLQVNNRDGCWLWKCWAGCGGGSVIDALMVRDNKTAGDAMKDLGSNLGVSITRDVELTEPLLDMAAAEAFVAAAHETLMGSFELQETFMLGKRGFQSTALIKKYRLGFVHGHVKIQGSAWKLTAWVLPICTASGRLQGVKLHNEHRYFESQPKCQWAKFGTAPRTDPLHGLSTLWPPPEQHVGKPAIILAGGELKALAFEESGLAATSVTVGEGKLPEHLIWRLKHCGFTLVSICYDDDAAGVKWRDNVSRQLADAGIGTDNFTIKPVYPTRPPAAQRVTVGSLWSAASGKPAAAAPAPLVTLPPAPRPQPSREVWPVNIWPEEDRQLRAAVEWLKGSLANLGDRWKLVVTEAADRQKILDAAAGKVVTGTHIRVVWLIELLQWAFLHPSCRR